MGRRWLARWPRWGRGLVLGLVALILALGVSGCQRSQTGQAVTEIRIGILNTPNDVAVARQLGYFQAAFPHQKLKFITFDSGVDANKALLSGGVDFATMGDTNGVVALAAEIPVQLCWINEICGANEALVVRRGAGIKRVKDLAGRKIATPFASTSHYSLMSALSQAGIRDQVTLLDMDTQNIVAAWQRGNIDAAYTWQPTLAQLLPEATVLCDSADLAQQGITTGNITLVRTQFAQAHPHLTQRFVATLDQAHQLRRRHFSQAVSAAARQVGISQREARLQMQGTTWPGASAEFSSAYLGAAGSSGAFVQAMTRTGQFMAGQQTITTAPSEQQFIDFIWKRGKQP
ncbi:ABC transporter substrate-binding protein [Lapidilactobacillus achengensis]|uniref:ABC transporter substrate-binding protein n=1 Tax=Lapidilactobacillus achengensis TaxID=2486000 RepID=A0ABW1UM68_9LACO|nr:ABC transporter substrate-binding protein [Lapidilactobacillus achengensis]